MTNGDVEMARMFMKRQPSRLRGGPGQMAQYREMVEQESSPCPEFPDALRQFALDALSDEDGDWVRRALQALAVVGDSKDVHSISALKQHSEENVRVDAETCLFEIKKREQ